MNFFRWGLLLFVLFPACTHRNTNTQTVSSKDYYIQKINKLKQSIKYPDTTCLHHNIAAEKFIAENLENHKGCGILFFINDACSSCISEAILLAKKLNEDSIDIPVYLVHKHNDFVLVEYYMSNAKIEYKNIYKYNYYPPVNGGTNNLSDDRNDIFLIYNNRIISFVE